MANAAAKEFFDEWSIYDAVLDRNYMFHDDLYRGVGRAVAGHFGARAFSVLDLGCGSARHLAAALRGRQLLRYVGYDLSDVALSHAGKNVAPLNCPVEFRRGDFLEGLSDGAEPFDLIFCGFSLHHLAAEETRKVFAAAHRRLASGGLLLVVDTMRQSDEDRERYLDRYCGWIRSEWKALSPAALDTVCGHVRQYDFPQTARELEARAAEAGFSRRREIDRFRWHRTWAFERDSARIREAAAGDAAAIARVHVDSWRTTYRGVFPEEVLARLTYEARAESWRKILVERARGEPIYVAAEADGTILGFASGGPERSGSETHRGEIYAIYLVESAQRRGLGRRLVAAVAERLNDAGCDSLLIWVLANNPCRGFYAALGGEIVAEKPLSIGKAEHIEVAYGWRDINLLLGSKA